MKIDFIIISGILVIMTFLPFILFPILSSKEEKNLRKKFKEEALRLVLNISFQFNWNTNIAGIDILKREFLFVQKPDLDFVIQHVDLNKVSQIKLVSHNTEFRLQDKLIQTLSRVDLEFSKNNTSESVTINLFDSDSNYTQDLEIKNAEKLVAELQKYLNAQPVLKRTA
jgi:hypothetical protein